MRNPVNRRRAAKRPCAVVEAVGGGPPRVRLAAARAMFEYAIRMRESVDHETRLTELERRSVRTTRGQ